ncbi:3'-5' exonuclease family protein [Actinomadura rudentiformis]|uniref:Exonuclease domain-containing protein n=1 Tax=Actinomadura rudentiformis TaxID=359158 RepID=A0A6H9YT32_9ACTN|nr:hypothetical protein [Actinomadura rudentiformis]KAB2347320.1 hypothetical protein F8566_20120 [Actinomadura rudentiformis]
MTRICFLDTETTGLGRDDDIWEFAAIVREPDGAEWEYHMFIQHDTQRCARLPEEFLTDHRARFPISGDADWHPDVRSRKGAAYEIANILSGGPHIVGAVPSFDTERIALLLRRFGLEPDWHYHLIDVETMAVGWLNGVAARVTDEALMDGHEAPALDRSRLAPPWDSNAIARAIGVDPDAYERHTAMGDVRWVRAQYDAITSNGPKELSR